MRKRFGIGSATAVLALLATTALTGCGHQSPAVGEWKGQVKGGGVLGAMAAQTGVGAASMTLKADGTGFVKTGMAPEQPVSWTEKDGKVVFTNAKSGGQQSGGNGNLVGTLAPDGRTMSVDLGPLRVEMEKQTGK